MNVSDRLSPAISDFPIGSAPPSSLHPTFSDRLSSAILPTSAIPHADRAPFKAKDRRGLLHPCRRPSRAPPHRRRSIITRYAERPRSHFGSEAQSSCNNAQPLGSRPPNERRLHKRLSAHSATRSRLLSLLRPRRSAVLLQGSPCCDRRLRGRRGFLQPVR
jgi:hypothetical protein